MSAYYIDRAARSRTAYQVHKTQLYMSTFAVEKSHIVCDSRCGSGTALVHKEVEMRILETAAVGVIAIASQFLVIAAVLI